MRTAIIITSVLSICLFISVAARAEDSLLIAKVYRDYPGYINPAICENPNLEKRTVPAPASNETANNDKPAAASPEIPPATANKTATCDAASSGIHAGDASFPYMGIWAGLVATRDADLDAGSASAELTFEHGYGGGVTAGYDFGPARVEIEGNYHRNPVDKLKFAGASMDASGTLKIRAVFANVFADFNAGGTSSPYLGGGIGYADVELYDHDDDQVLAGQLAAGVVFAVSPTVAIDLGYRFMTTEDPDFHGVDLEVRQHTAMLGVQFRF